MVKCKDCAFLSLKDSHSSAFLEADAGYRSEGYGTNYLHSSKADGPICFRMAKDLQVELIATPEVHGKVRALEVISKEIDCDKFTAWMIGYSPKEVAEKLLNEQLLKNAEDRKVADEERAAVRRREDRDWQAAQQKLRESTDWKRRIYLAIFTIVVTPIAGGAGFWIKGYFDQQIQQAKSPQTPNTRF